MEFKFGATRAETLFEGKGGCYYTWSSAQNPPLAQNNVGAGRLLLHPSGFALPHYADSSKLGFVVQGNGGVAGMIFPKEKEVVLRLRKGDVIPVPNESVSWWFNDGDSDFEIVFLGETSKALINGDFTYFFLTGAVGILRGFSDEFIRKTYAMTEEEADTLVKTQTGTLIVELKDGNYNIPRPQKECNSNKLVFNVEDPVTENGSLVTETEFPFLREVGLSFFHEKVSGNGVSSPISTADAAAQLVYVVKGSGQFEIVGISGKQVLNEVVKAGQLLVVPRFFVVGKTAGPEGLECCAIFTSSKPVIHELKGKKSVWEAMSPEVLRAALDVGAEFVKLFRSNAD